MSRSILQGVGSADALFAGLNTKLNAKQGGQLVTLVDASSKPELLKAVTSKTPEQALE